ncbi:MAG: arginine decarboxylase [Flavobacteriaceae bacterium]|nr:MAG: arginine decarboxylase [Flavobacteriaceae bacterium]
MKLQYIDYVTQGYDFPPSEFAINANGELLFHNINVHELTQEYGSPVKFTYLPQISNNIQKVKGWFNVAMSKLDYQAQYHYCYCTKSSHFAHVLEEAVSNGIHLETSSAFDINIIESLEKSGKITKDKYIVCNGFKRDQYIENIARIINDGFYNTLPVVDNYQELDLLSEQIKGEYSIGIRIAAEEEPKFNFYTSRLGIGYRDILPWFHEKIKNNQKVKLKMLHFFINTGITDTAYYWNELSKCLRIYAALKRVCPDLDSLNIGGGFPIKNSLDFEYDYQYMIEEIITQIKNTCEDQEVPVPHIFTEFGSYTVGEASMNVYKILHQKRQNDREKWNMIDSSFITTLPDSWAINKKFLMLPINRWNDNYERVFLGGLTCDSDDYYNSEQNNNAIYLPKFSDKKPLYIGFFNTGAYQESIGGYGGIHHCLIPNPKHVILNRDKDGNLTSHLFSEQQTHEQMLDLLGYKQ